MKDKTDFTLESRLHIPAKMGILLYPVVGIIVLTAMTICYYLLLGYGFLWVLLSS